MAAVRVSFFVSSVLIKPQQKISAGNQVKLVMFEHRANRGGIAGADEVVKEVGDLAAGHVADPLPAEQVLLQGL